MTRQRLIALSHVQWTVQIEHWTIGQIRRNLWRFDTIYEFEDVMQEAQLLFYKIRRYYPLVDEPANLFSLYKIALGNLFTDKARKRRATISTDPIEDTMFQGIDVNMGSLAFILDNLPSELKLVFEALTTGRVRLKVDRTTKRPRLRENLNTRLKRKFSLSMTDPVGELKTYLSNA